MHLRPLIYINVAQRNVNIDEGGVSTVLNRGPNHSPLAVCGSANEAIA